MNRLPLIAFLACLQISAGGLLADDILSNLGGFEQPTVSARTPKEKGGDPSVTGERGLFWSFSHRHGEKGGSLTAGLSNETSRSGSQSLYVEAEKFSARYEGAGIQTNPIPVVPGHTYKLSIWGKMDAKNPFVIQNRPIYLKMQTDFLAADKTTQTGETVYLVQPIPGTKNRDPFFNEKTWTEFGTEFATPADAAYEVVTWRWESGSETGDTSGVIYFDDFTIQGDMPEQSLSKLIEKDPAVSPEEPATVEPADPAEVPEQKVEPVKTEPAKAEKPQVK